ncbi:MAG TPA: TRASH domain-containing protein [Thermoguttaceae bacterium]|nr:TRASH domain-containing protein [Thermoguttaceae bacterium]
MVKRNGLLSWAMVVGVAVALGGCGSRSSNEKPRPADVPSSETAEGLAELSDADAAAAKKQGTCPVSGEVLGAMGKPYKVTIQDRTIFLCCPGCEEELRKNPEKYLLKIEE